LGLISFRFLVVFGGPKICGKKKKKKKKKSSKKKKKKKLFELLKKKKGGPKNQFRPFFFERGLFLFKGKSL